MGDKTGIAWTDATWNPVVGCSRVSEGCRHCYAERQAFRHGQMMARSPYKGLTEKVGAEIRWTGEVRLVENALALPLRWRRPRRIFVNSMSDLFHESLSDECIGRVFEIMGSAQQHTYQILTKRPERMQRFISHHSAAGGQLGPWPWPHVWLGVSVENQETADERIPLLLKAPAAVHWISAEPLLGPVDLRRWLEIDRLVGSPDYVRSGFRPELSWVVIGGESGPGARPFDLGWARQVIEQCRAAGASAFMKQVGAHPHEERSGRVVCRASHLDGCGAGSWSKSLVFEHSSGADPSEWSEDLRVREWPA